MGDGNGDSEEERETGGVSDAGDRPGTDSGVHAADEVLDCLKNPRRRFVLTYLDEHEVADVDELAREIAIRETDATESRLPDDVHDQIVTNLLHTHLPKLAELHFVEYDRRSRAVRFSDASSVLDRFLQFLADVEDHPLDRE